MTGPHEERPRPPSDAGNDAPVCSTSEAARILGVSNTTVQIMVERGELDAWRTRGGHRRITHDSIERLKASRSQRSPRRNDPEQLEVLLVEDDLPLRTLYERTIGSWQLPVKVSVAANGMEALLLIERKRPDLLITDLFMSPVDGFELLRMLREHHEFDDMVVIVVTGLDESELAQRGGLPKGVVVYGKPVPFEKLHGFFESSLMRKQLESR